MKKLIDLNRLLKLVGKRRVQKTQKAGKTDFEIPISPGTRPVIDNGKITGRI